MSWNLTSANGQGSVDASIPCSSAGDGPSYRYGYSGAAASPGNGALAGTWSGTVEVHQSDLAGGAFVPAGTGRVAIQTSLGAVNASFSAGSCTAAPLSFGLSPGGDPLASGSMPVTITSGTGSLRGITGSGTVAAGFELGGGADNTASLALSGTVTAMNPAIAIGTPTATYPGLINWLQNNLTVSFPISDGGPSTSVGDAFGVRLTGASLSGAGAPSGVPASFGELASGSGTTATVVFHGVAPSSSHTLTITVASTDAVGNAAPPVVLTVPIKTPLLPS